MRSVIVCVACVVCIGAWSGAVTPAAAADDVVVYASDAVAMSGAWSRVAESTAAGGQKASSTDHGRQRALPHRHHICPAAEPRAVQRLRRIGLGLDRRRPDRSDRAQSGHLPLESASLPYLGSPVVLPGSIDAAHFDTVGEGTSFHDTTAGNSGGAYRSTDVDLEASSDGGYDVGWLSTGEWLNYSVTVATSWRYTVQLRVASPSGGGAMHVGFNGSGVWSAVPVPVPVTGGWETWTTVSLPVSLTAGTHIADIRLTNGDSQAIAGWNGPGPFLITNNYLEATGENFLLGGSDPPIYGLVPSDVTFTRNTVSKRVTWRTQGYAVKNLIELKNAQRVTIDGNVLEYNWSGSQSGQAIVLTPRNQDGGAPWSIVQGIAITNNAIRHVAGVLNVLGTDYRYPSQPLSDTHRRHLGRLRRRPAGLRLRVHQ